MQALESPLIPSSYPLSSQFVALLYKLKFLKDAGKFCDVVLHIGEKAIQAHKNVLSAWSPYFDAALTECTEKQEHLSVACESHEDAFLQMVDFMYSGKANVTESNVACILSLADQFKIEPLTTCCEHFLKSNIHIKNFVTVCSLARRFRLKTVQDNIASFVQVNLSEATKQPEFNSLSPAWIDAFMSMDSMLVLKPEYKVFLVVGWINADFENRQKYLALLFSKVNWTDLSSDFLLEISKSENFFTSNYSCLYLLLDSICKAGLPLGPYSEGYQHLREKNQDICAQTQVDKVPDLPNDDTITAITLSQYPDKTAEPAVIEDDNVYEDGGNHQICALSDSQSFVNSLGSDDDLAEPFTIHVTSPKVSLTRSCRRPARRKGIPVKLRNQQDVNEFYTSPSKRNKLNVKTEVLLADDLDLRNAPAKKRVGRPRKGLKVDKEYTPKMTRKKGRPRKSKTSENHGPVEKSCYSDSFFEDQKSMSVKDRSTWRKCNVENCDFRATIIQEMEVHMMTVHEKDQSHCCDICDFRSSYQRIYSTHMKVHFEGPPFCCDYPGCQYKSERINPLLTHRLIHSDKYPYECGTCQAKFRSTLYLRIHERTHTGERPFECEICQKGFATKGTLEQHMISHTKLRPFLCDTCGFSTKYQSHFVAHKRIHTGDVFRCKYPNCTYVTPKRGQIKSHLRSHLGIRGYTCPTCGRAFIERSHLVRHERIHKSEKSFSCDKCEYSSSRKDKLKEHVLKHHAGNENAIATTTPYKKPRTRRMKDQILVPSVTDSAVHLLEQMVQSSTPAKFLSNSAKVVDEEELANNIQQLQAEQKRVADSIKAEKKATTEVGNTDLLREALAVQPGQVIHTIPGQFSKIIQQYDAAGYSVNLEQVGVAQEIVIREGGDLTPKTVTYSTSLGQPISQSLNHLQSPHMSVNIIPGEGHLSHEALALAQSVAESVVMNTHPPVLSHTSQTTTLNNLTITTLEYMK